LVCFEVIWYIFTFSVYCAKNNLATLANMHNGIIFVQLAWVITLNMFCPTFANDLRICKEKIGLTRKFAFSPKSCKILRRKKYRAPSPLSLSLKWLETFVVCLRTWTH
jgi:hypothetical protein